MKFRFLSLSVLTCWLLSVAGVQALAGSEPDPARRPLRVMAWNVENLFDTVHDEGFSDEDFLPNGAYQWTPRRFWRKLTDMARVVATVADDGAVPDLIGLCEVENDSVLHALTRRSVLRQLGYSYVMSHGIDPRGIDVALLYQPVHFRLLEHRDLRVPCHERGWSPTRDILYAKGLVLAGQGVDTLHVFVTHLPSRAGGQDGDRKRRLAAETLWGAVDSLCAASVGRGEAAPPKVVVMGDFNAGRRDRVFRHSPLLLTDDRRDKGTYYFRGQWEWLDHILVSSSVTTQGSSQVVRLPWLLEKTKNGKDMPRRIFRGPSYHGGVSDHLPVVLDLWF